VEGLAEFQGRRGTQRGCEQHDADLKHDRGEDEGSSARLLGVEEVKEVKEETKR
jgi:hypothetical protein